MRYKTVIGIDISKSTFDVSLLLDERTIINKFSNNNKGFKLLLQWLSKNKINKNDFTNIYVCMEATGIYGESLATFLDYNGFFVSVVNPAQIKGFARSELSRTKTDKCDCQLIARFCRAINPKAWKPTPKHIKELQALVHRLEDLKNLQQQETNRYDVAEQLVKSSIKHMINYLNKEIKKLIIKSRN